MESQKNKVDFHIFQGDFLFSACRNQHFSQICLQKLKQIHLMLGQVSRMSDPRIDDDLITETMGQLAKVITHLKDGC